MAALLTAAGCTSSESGSTDETPGVHPETYGVVEELEVGAIGATVATDGVSVAVAPNTSSSPIVVRIRQPIPTTPDEVTGNVVEVDHTDEINKPVSVSWNISELDEGQRQTLILLRWDETEGLWLTEEHPYRIDDDQLVASITDWSFWDWAASASQETQELAGRRKDPPQCSDDLPEWVRSFVDPDEDTSAAAILACIEDDAADSSVITMRMVNNRTFAQFVSIESGEGFAWNWAGDIPTGVTDAVHAASAVVLNGQDRILIPPLHEVAVGVRRPGTPSPNQFVGFSSELSPVTALIDIVAFGAGEAGIPEEAFDNPLTVVFLEFVIECGAASLATFDGNALDLVTTLVGAVSSCVKELTDCDSQLGRRFQQAVSERIVAYGTPEKARTAIRANRALNRLSSFLKLLKVAEVSGYLADLGLEGLVGSLTWSLNLDGEVQQPGAWTPTCSNVEADRMAWSRNWVPQPVFQAAPKLDFHEYDEFESIITAATGPFANCSDEHIAAVRADVERTGLPDPTSQTIALAAFDNLLPGTGEPPSVGLWDRIASASIPGVCGHAPTTLVAGEDVEVTPQEGYFQLLQQLGSAGPAFVAFPGSGGDFIAAVASCSAGGVGWPNLIIIFDSTGAYLAHTFLDDHDWEPFGFWAPGRGAVSRIEASPKGFFVTVGMYRTGEDGCCYTGEAQVEVEFRSGVATVTEVRSHNGVSPPESTYDSPAADLCAPSETTAWLQTARFDIAVCYRGGSSIYIGLNRDTGDSIVLPICAASDFTWVATNNGYRYEVDMWVDGVPSLFVYNPAGDQIAHEPALEIDGSLQYAYSGSIRDSERC